MKLPSVLILAPCYVSSYGPARDSVGNLMATIAEEGGKIRIKSAWRSSNPGEVRTLCVEHFAISSDYDIVLWVDDDNCFSPTDGKRIINECAERNAMIGALYRSRSEQGKLVCGGMNEDTIHPNSGVQEVEWIGFGLTAMPMPLVRTMWGKYGQDMFRDIRTSHEIGSNKIELSKAKGEDVAFCRNLRKLGQSIYVHTDVKIGHIGPTIFHVGE